MTTVKSIGENHNVFWEIRADLHSNRCIPGLTTGLVIGLVLIIVQLSFATLIFSGPLEIYIQRGVGMALAGNFVLSLLAALFSRVKPIISIPQDAPVALLSGIAAGLVVTLGSKGESALFITVTAALISSTLLTGLFFLFIGRFKLAELFRYMPYPVIGGFLAGTGYLLSIGGLEVMTGLSLTPSQLLGLVSFSRLYLWVPGVFYAIVLFMLLRYHSHFLILPLSLLLATLLYHLVLSVLNIPLREAIELGLFYQPFTTGSLWPSFSLLDFQDVEWLILLKQLPAIMVIPFISLLGLLLNTNGIELFLKREIDMNYELLFCGTANLLGGLTGSYPGYHALSLTVLGVKVKADTRLVGLTTAVILLMAIIFGSQILAVFPKAILGCFLLLCGFFFLWDWLVETKRKMPKLDYLLLWLVFLIICSFGFMVGVLVGLITTIFLFVFRFSQIPLLRSISSGATQHSLKGRTLPQQRLLSMYGERIMLFQLEGYMFFGSVTSLIKELMDFLGGSKTPIDVIILDFTGVTGFDISAISNFVRLFNRFFKGDLVFALAKTPPSFAQLLREHFGGDSTPLYYFPDLEGALQFAEDRLLEKEESLLASSSKEARLAQDFLFDKVYGDLFLELDRRELVESLLDEMEDYLITREYSKDMVVLERDQRAEGLYVVQQGVVAEMLYTSNDESTSLRNLGPASIFAELGAYGEYVCAYTYVAKTDLLVSILTPIALNTLEEVNLSLAVKVHRLVIQLVGDQQFTPELSKG